MLYLFETVLEDEMIKAISKHKSGNTSRSSNASINIFKCNSEILLSLQCKIKNFKN